MEIFEIINECLFAFPEYSIAFKLLIELNIRSNYGNIIKEIIKSDIEILNSDFPVHYNLSGEYIHNKIEQCNYFINHEDYKKLLY